MPAEPPAPDDPPTPGGWTDTVRKLKGDFMEGKKAAERHMNERTRLSAERSASLVRVKPLDAASALVVAVIQCETVQFGVSFAFAWLTGAAPIRATRLAAAMGAALASRDALRPVRFLSELVLFQSTLASLRKIKREGHREELRERLLKTLAAVLALLMTVRAIDRTILPGDAVCLLPEEMCSALCQTALTAHRWLDSLTATMHSFPLLRPLLFVIDLDARLAIVFRRLWEGLSITWRAVEPSLLNLRMMIFK
ncbi:hypothetical protein AB1Y20_022463 [Prymnesium parvum]|uniref:Peroxisomal membrane protein PEX16 n=1 Tax=Prymnesium parvum TaxID=97485 RepID=A0AB34JI08_PRYPA